MLLAAALAGLLASACTGDGNGNGNGDGKTNGPSRSGPTPTTSQPTTTIEPSGEPGSVAFTFSAVGVAASLVLKGERGTLQVLNRSGREVGPPAIYVLRSSDGSRVDAQVKGAEPIPDGSDRVKFDVAFPEGFDPKQIGLVNLVLGDEDFGAFFPADLEAG